MHLKDLNLTSHNTFKLCYDTGDDWEFEIKIYKARKEFDSEVFGKVIDGAGKSIWEDNHYSFYKFLKHGVGSLSQEEKEYIESNCYISIDEFDEPIDIEFLNDELECSKEICEHLLEMREMYL